MMQEIRKKHLWKERKKERNNYFGFVVENAISASNVLDDDFVVVLFAASDENQDFFYPSHSFVCFV